MAPTRVKLTYDDYAALGDEKRYDLIEGDLCMIPAPSWRHQDIVLHLATRLLAHVRERGLGKVVTAPVDVILTDTDVVQPDVLYVSRERMGRIAEEGLRGAPDLVVEVLSPATASRDRKPKAALYARHGVRELWIVDPDAERIEVFVPAETRFRLDALYEGDQTVRSYVLPELNLRAGEVFPELPEQA